MNPGELFGRFGRLVVAHRGWMLLLVAAITAASLAGLGLVMASGLPVDFTPQALFQDDSPAIQRLTEIEETFGREDNDLVIVLEGPIGEAGAVEAIRALHAAVEADPHVASVDSLANATIIEAEGGMLTVVSVLDDLTPAEAVARLAADPSHGGLLVARDQQAAELRVHLDPSLERVGELTPAIKSVMARVEAVALPAGLALHVTGVPWVRTEVVAMMLADNARFVPLLSMLFLVVIWGLFGRFWTGMAPLVTVLVAVAWGMALLLVNGAVLNILSILVPTLVLVVGLSDGIHVVARYREERAARGNDAGEAMAATLRHMSVACFLTTFTTAAGFGSLVVADTKVMRDVGLHCAVAVMVAWVATMLVLPTWLAWLPPERVGRSRTAESGERLQRALGWLDEVVARHPRALVLGTAALVLACVALGSGVRTNTHMLEMYRPGHPTRETVGLVARELGGVVPIVIHVAGPPDALLEPDNLARLATMEAATAARPETGWTLSVAAHIRNLHRLLTDEDGLPGSREAVAQELLLSEMSGGLPLDRLVTSDYSRARVLALCDDVGGQAFLTMRDELQAQADALFEGTGLTAEVTGDGIVASAGLERLIDDLISSLALVLVVIVLTLIGLLRSVRLALLASIPNLVPLLFTLATLRLIGADLQTTNIVSFTVALGLAVDDTIHFVVRYQDERKLGADREDAIRRTYLGAGTGIVLTSVLLVAGFGVLMTSDLTSTRHFGLLSSVTMLAALLGDLVLLPALLHLFGRRLNA